MADDDRVDTVTVEVSAETSGDVKGSADITVIGDCESDAAATTDTGTDKTGDTVVVDTGVDCDSGVPV